MNKTKTKTIYIAGKMTGEINYNFYNFFRVEKELLKKGYNVINPAFEALALCNEYNKNLDQIDYETYFNSDIALLKFCSSAILMLDGWEKSKGAKIELDYAKENGYTILFEKDLCLM
jgi:hypothetical protein